MGCDIHLFTERKRSINNKSKWVNVDHWKINPYHGIDKSEPRLNLVELYGGRNYPLFGMLAGVRNYNENPVMSQPKGLPKDCSLIVKNESDIWGSDGHSHSFFTLEEIKSFRKKNKVTKYSGMMSVEQAKKVDSGEMPDYWCKWTSDKSAVYREWEFESDTLKGLVKKLEKRKREEFYLYGNEERPEFDKDIRIVFWFDN